MQHLFQSAFLQALGFAIANSLWQTAFVWLIFMCINGLTLRSSARYRLAVSAQLISFAWFVITLFYNFAQYDADRQLYKLVGKERFQSLLPVNESLSPQMANWVLTAEQLLPYLSLAYLCLMLVLGIRWFLGYRHTQSVRYTGLQKIPADWHLFVKKIAVRFGIKKEIGLFLSETISTPLTIGFFKPVILIPIASINHLTTDQLEAVLLHELAHIKRYDYLVNIILSIAEIALFFNPFTRLLGRNIRRERENACDDWVLQFQYNASIYAEALLQIAYLQTRPAFAMGATGRKNDLLVRVKRIINKKENRFTYRKQLMAFVVIAAILSSFAWLNPRSTSHTVTGADSIQPAKSSLLTTLEKKKEWKAAMPFFNPVTSMTAPIQPGAKIKLSPVQHGLQADSWRTGEIMPAIGPMVADALEQAAEELSGRHDDWHNALANLNFQKLDFSKMLMTDSLLKDMHVSLRSDFSKSLKAMQKDIEKAESDIRNASNEGEEIYINREKLSNDVLMALTELKKIGIDKLVSNALQVPGRLFSDKFLRNAMPPGKEKIKINKAVPEEKDLPESGIIITPDNMETIEPSATSAVLNQAIAAKISGLHNATASIRKLENVARIERLIREMDKKRVTRLVSQVYTEKMEGDKKSAILLR